MLSPRWRKVFADLWLNKTRTVLVVLSIAVGVFALGAIIISRDVLSRDLSESYMAINPSSGMIMTNGSFDDSLVESVRRMREVEEAEGRRNAALRLQVGPDEWRDIQIFAIPDYKNIRINKVRSQSGEWPPPLHEILIERSALTLAQVEEGDMVTVRTPAGRTRNLRIAGVTHDLSRFPAMFDGTIYGYVTFPTLEWLGEERDYNEMHFVVAENKFDRDHVLRVGNLVQRKIERAGLSVFYTLIFQPGKHPMHDTIQTMLLLLGVLGFLSLVLSGFLVVNTISAILAQQVRQIGIMKAIGARQDQIITMYLVMVLLFGALSLFVAVPLGAAGAWLFSQFMASLFNFDLTNFGIPPVVLAVQFGVGLITPVLAALYPVIRGSKVTAREAMSDYGVGQVQSAQGLIDRVLGRIGGLSRPVLLSLRNTFRRKGRLALTLATLTLGGAIFIAVFSVQASLLATLDDLLDVWNYDVWVMMNRPYRIEKLETEARLVPGVKDAIGLDWVVARRVRDDDSESDNLFLFAPPNGSSLVNPVIDEGRYLLPEDENAVVITSAFLKNEPDIKLGDDIVLTINGRKTTWRLVGISQWLAPVAYVNYSHLSRVAGGAGRVSSVALITEEPDIEFQKGVAQAAERHFSSKGLQVAMIESMAEEKAQVEASFSIVIVLLLIMAVLMAAVGGLGLMGTMSINVLERTREIGVMRAIGASDGSILQVFLVEGVIIGLISWLIGAAVAFPLSRLLSDAVGIAFMAAPLSYTFGESGLILWFVVVITVSALASFLPARGASRLTVREVLAYE